MTGWEKIITTFFLILILALPLFCAAAEAEETVSVPYVDAAGAAQGAQACTPLLGGNENKVLNEGWYVVQGEISFSEGMIVTGNTNLILEDHCVLNASDGIWVQENAALTIWAQSTLSEMGRLSAVAASAKKAGIGGIEGEKGGAIVINGGNIYAEGGPKAPGIGAGYGRKADFRAITINGGIVTAKGFDQSAGIGGSDSNEAGGTVTINGGTVKSNSGKFGGPGIGMWNVGDVVITGGQVQANTENTGQGMGICANRVTISGDPNRGDYVQAHGSGKGAGITGNDITINSGRVEAVGGKIGAAGIGSNYHSHCDTPISINGGIITATGSGGGAGIGSGFNGNVISPITINGGTVTAAGGTTIDGRGGAGIGAGTCDDVQFGDLETTVTITGGTVTANGGGNEKKGGAGIGAGYQGNASASHVNISGGVVTAIGGSRAAGIGGGAERLDYGGEGSHVSITGDSVVVAQSGGYKSCAIGNGGGDSTKGSLFIGAYLKVQAGNVDTIYEQAFPLSERVDRCQDRYSVRIEPCDHPQENRTLTVEAFTHVWVCECCGWATDERHNLYGDNGTCTVCGYIGRQSVISYVLADGITERTLANWSGIETHMTDGWYALIDRKAPDKKVFDIDETITVSGSVNLILCDGATLNANDGIFIPEGSSLTLWAQAGHSGALVARPESGPGIGGVNQTKGGRLVINGGQITAQGGADAAGIGGGYGDNSGFTAIIINGAREHTVVNATGGKNAAGIGGGEYNKYVGSIIINGGDVTAHGGDRGAGIGGGEDRAPGFIAISGGKIKAEGGKYGAGIGGGDEGTGGTVVITGGDITANGTNGGAGIGGGDKAKGERVTIYSGNVYAHGGGKGAGIGGGREGDGGDVTIEDGDVTANGGWDGGAGIGGGYEADSGTLVIMGGEVKATGHAGGAGIGAGRENGGVNVAISGGTVNGDGGGSGQGSGIGGGYSSDTWGTVTISGGTVTANGGDYRPGIGSGHKSNASGLTVNISGGEVTVFGYSQSAGIGGGGETNDGKGGEGANVNITGGIVVVNSAHTAIGHGGTDKVMGNLFIADNMKVYAGNNGTNYERDGMPFTAFERVGACQYRHCARIELCDHPLPVVENIPVMAFDAVTEAVHKRSACAYCGFVFAEEAHDFDDTGVCVVCAYKGSFARVSFDANGAAGEAMKDAYVAPGGVLTLPACTFTAPGGRVFSGWRIGDKVYRAGDAVPITEDVTAFAQWTEAVIIVYDANGGSGTMTPDEVYAGQLYPLLPCGFDAPAGRVFSMWEVNGKKKLPLAEITVTEDTTVKALWTVPFGAPDLVLPGDVKSIEEYAFEGIAASVVVIPDGCETIGAYAFKDCPNLTQIRIPAGSAIGESAFEGCEHVYVFGTAGSDAEQYCANHDNCEFVAE